LKSGLKKEQQRAAGGSKKGGTAVLRAWSVLERGRKKQGFSAQELEGLIEKGGIIERKESQSWIQNALRKIVTKGED